MNSIWRKLAKASTILWESGPTGLAVRLAEARRDRRHVAQYKNWLLTKGHLSAGERAAMTASKDLFAVQPLISIILPVYNIDEKWLRLCIESVLSQMYTKWELCIADDASPAPHVRAVLDEYSARDDRIKVIYREQNGHISAASNSALEHAKGEYIALLDHDDELSPDALYWVVNEINLYPDAALLYSDEDVIDEDGHRYDPKFKPDFSRDLLYSLNLLTHLAAYRTDLVRSVGGFRVGYEGSQDYDLELRVLEHIDESQIRHIPRILYHWRAIRGSVAFSMDEKPYAHECARNAIRDHFERTGIQADVLEAVNNLHRVSYQRPGDDSAVTIIVSGPEVTSHLPAEWNRHETKLVHAGPDRKAWVGDLNEAAASARGEVLIFLDANLRVVDSATLDELIGYASQSAVGAVAGRILKNDYFVEQSGIILGKDLRAFPAHEGYVRGATGNMLRNRHIGNYAAVSISCMAIRKKLFTECGGFNANFAAFDVDLCLRLRALKKRIVGIPSVEFIREGSPPTREITTEDAAHLQQRWPEYVEHDPFCNVNLKRDGSFEIEL